ncbi:MAG: response regulator transcription factor [Spirochaetales bacterium]|nr:response regulator transcription factor [Spirochaetales bacterium]
MKKILVVEDEKKLNKMICDYLEAVGWETVSAFDGITALKIIRDEPPEFVILDVMLPGVDGMDVLRRLRETAAVPVIMLTARAEEGDKLMGLELGADDYMTKPFSLKELSARIRAVERRYKPGHGGFGKDQIIEYGDLKLDPVKRVLLRLGQEVKLTSVQFDIMAAFIKNPGRVFTRMDLLNVFQEDAYDGYERTIDVHIKNIRKALEPDHSHPKYIETVWRVGYKLAEDLSKEGDAR